jgi:hypothetical protein
MESHLMSLPGPASLAPASSAPLLWLVVYSVRLALFLLSGGLLARRSSPLSWRFWLAAPGFIASALDAGLAAALARRLKPRGRWFIPLLALSFGASSAVAAIIVSRLLGNA